METSNYRFFNHRACEFFPCHKVADPDSFNCLFCYCPLYALGDKCGGSFQYTADGIKDCSACLVPHSRGGYDHVMAQYPKLAQLARKPAMEAFVVDAFTQQIFGGNQAGVVLLGRGQDFPAPELMQAVAGELKHSETAFVRLLEGRQVHIRYFTPAGEVDLCGHATIAAFVLLADRELIGDGAYLLHTAAGVQSVRVEGRRVYLTISPTQVLQTLSPQETARLLAAYGLAPDQGWPGLPAALVCSGLTDIMLPVKDHQALMAAVQDEAAVCALSRQYDAVGVHMFCPGQGDVSAYCSNFAPLWSIPEECATGTANAGLTRYLTQSGVFAPGQEQRIVQGEHMGRPSEILTLPLADGSGVEVGGTAVVSMQVQLRL